MSSYPPSKRVNYCADRFRAKKYAAAKLVRDSEPMLHREGTMVNRKERTGVPFLNTVQYRDFGRLFDEKTLWSQQKCP
jgi:hypothetical protein